jgi:hypothetical protein
MAALRRVASDAVAVFAMVLIAVALCGCSAAPLIDSHAADYRDTEASAGDAQLLQNILRAKDNLPIHFADLSNIHGSIQLTAAGTASVAFANLIGSTIPSTAGPTLSAQTSPTSTSARWTARISPRAFCPRSIPASSRRCSIRASIHES